MELYTDAVTTGNYHTAGFRCCTTASSSTAFYQACTSITGLSNTE